MNYRGDIETSLIDIKGAGTFATGGKLAIQDYPLPEVTVKDVGLIALPFDPLQAPALIAKATRAPYGQGTQTIVDETVRRSWQLDAGEVQLGRT